ncbi:MAG: hypothetical protein NC817_01250, partial [Candidatus Omnitrophica bacterium]|nr:hypothetical protein [Candidatus Omnitrophota bacterium]
RVSLRESNADIRLAHMGFKYGLISKDEYQLILEKKEKIDTQIKKLKSTKVLFEGKRLSLFDILKRPKIDYKDIEPYLNDGNLNSSYPHIEDIKREVEIEIKYEGFMRREMAFLREIDNFDRIKIPPKLDFSKVPSLSKEVVEKLNKFRPVTLGEAIRISGITPAAILNIYNFIKKN